MKVLLDNVKGKCVECSSCMCEEDTRKYWCTKDRIEFENEGKQCDHFSEPVPHIDMI